MIGTVWNNGKYHANGSGYGIKILQEDRDRYFDRDWKNVILEIGDEKIVATANVDKPSFWHNCRELISKEIGMWLIRQGKGTWEKGKPPKVRIEKISGNKFSVDSV